MNSEILKSLLGIPTSTSQSSLQQKLKSFMGEFDFHNVRFDDSSMYNNHPEFCVFINHAQDTVEPGLPKQVAIFCSLNTHTIEVSYLASSYDEENDSFPDFQDIETLQFSWQNLEQLILKYQPQTY